MTPARLLLDTHIVLWMRAEPGRLSAAEASAVSTAERLHASAATLWEIASLVGLGRIPPEPDLMAPQRGVELLPISPAHCVELSRLPRIHRDPFDRMLIAQARVEGLALVTRDHAIRACGAEGAVVFPPPPETVP
jgi:PIN domain nuclease of toxin-antitoxin system